MTCINFFFFFFLGFLFSWVLSVATYRIGKRKKKVEKREKIIKTKTPKKFAFCLI